MSTPPPTPESPPPGGPRDQPPGATPEAGGAGRSNRWIWPVVVLLAILGVLAGVIASDNKSKPTSTVVNQQTTTSLGVNVQPVHTTTTSTVTAPTKTITEPAKTVTEPAKTVTVPTQTGTAPSTGGTAAGSTTTTTTAP